MKGSDFNYIENELGIIVSYKDDKGNTYEEKEKVSIDLVELSAGEKMLLFVNALGRATFSGENLLMVLIIVLVFVFVFVSVFKKKRENEES